MSKQRSWANPWGDARFGGACVIVAGGAPLAEARGGQMPREDGSPLLPHWLTAMALVVTQERLRRGRWVSRVRVTDDETARDAVAQLRADGHAAVLGPPDEAHGVGWLNRNRAVPVGEKSALCFPWADAEAPAVVEIDPGGAFGAGTHPSTRLLAEWLAGELTGGERVLDVGCGSGVLALVAARLGAAEAVGIDIEPAAVSAAQANARRNGLDGVASFSTALVGSSELGTFDVVVANITADVLMPLAGDIAARVAPDGRLAVSGISAAQTSSVAAAYRPHGIELVDPVRLDDWVAVANRRSDDATA
ncbi:50S ribosomal protein L11 methyltransferase [Candidatus Poriferisodalis sp.]|uniref:50S ribosomal protein L11 methyltransferase n=1 Tax=Candidatus Poriferisodalis sp. TaxID=3101277 RepID=UPI003B52950D